jgi:hypothetical protein
LVGTDDSGLFQSFGDVSGEFGGVQDVEGFSAGGLFVLDFSDQSFVVLDVGFVGSVFRVQFGGEFDSISLSLGDELFRRFDLLEGGFELSSLVDLFSF